MFDGRELFFYFLPSYRRSAVCTSCRNQLQIATIFVGNTVKKDNNREASSKFVSRRVEIILSANPFEKFLTDEN